MKRLLIFLIMNAFAIAALAQTKQIKGRVFNSATGDPLPGVSIIADKKSGAATTTGDGTFTIKVGSNATTLVFSSVGYTTQTIAIGTSATIDVNLVPVTAAMDDVVVIGYGTQKKSSVTGAVSKYRNEKLDQAPVSRLDQALQGKIAGVTVQNLSSEAGATPKIRVRGLSSVNAGADPLVVVDGHPVPDGLAFVNMSDVESVEVLKDAASAAIYGSRGATGVILITTKSGKTDRPKYSVKVSSGTRKAYKTQDIMSVSEYVTLLFDEAALRNNDPSVAAGVKNRVSAAERAQYVVENTIFGGVPTDWQKEALRNANVSNVQVSISGGKKDTKYFISGAYNKDDGLMYHSTYDKVSLRGKFETQLSDRIKFNLNLNPTYTRRERPSTGYIDFVRFPTYLPARHTEASAAFVNQLPLWANIRPGDFAQVGHFNGRVYSGLMPDGSTWVNTVAVDPFSSSNNSPKSVLETRTITNDEYRMLSSGDLTINLSKGLDFKTTGSAYVTYSDGLDFARTNSNRQGDVNRGTYSNRLYIDLLTENTLNFTKRFGDHSITALAGFTAQKTTIKNAQTVATNFPSDNVRTLNTALVIVQPTIDVNGNQQGTFTNKNGIGLISYLGRATYSYKDRYLLAASFRRDGSSYFAPGKKYGTFPSLSAGWVVSKEKFLSKVDWLTQFKLRASYGATGNNKIVDFAFLDLLYPASYDFGSGTGTVVPAQLPSKEILSNSNITWERTFQYNFGTDISLFNNALTLSVDAYQSKTEKLLLLQSVLGFTGANKRWNNIGNLKNNGVEIELTSNNFRKKNFTWTTNVNLSHNKNKLTEFGGEAFQLNTGERNEVYSAQVGFQAIRFWGYKTDGVWLSQADADAAKAIDKGTANAATYFTAGGLKLVDLNGDGKIATDDRTDLGSPFPDFTWGINNSFTFKGFDLSFLVQGVQGAEVLNGDAFYNESRKYNRKYNNGNRWVSALNPGDGKTPYFTSGFDWMLTDYPIEDGSYFALREVIFGYTLPQKIAKAVRLESLRLYTSMQNAYVHWNKSYRGINPEARSTTSQYASPLIDGYQRGGFPMPRTVLFGLDINF